MVVVNRRSTLFRLQDLSVPHYFSENVRNRVERAHMSML